MSTSSPESDGRILTAVYDLTVCPVNFDFFNFLIVAEIERCERHLDAIRILIVYGNESHPFVAGMPYSEADHWWRLQNIILPGVTLLPSCRGVSILPQSQARAFLADDPQIFPAGYSLRKPIGVYSETEVAVAAAIGRRIPSLRPTDEARRYVADWLEPRASGRKSVVLTLRQSSYNATRNSNVEAWCEFARSLDREVYFPIIVPDTEAVFRAPDPMLDGLAVCPVAAVNLHFRAALFEAAYLNMHVGSGPTILCQLMSSARYQLFRPVVPGTFDASEEVVQASRGIASGGQLAYATPHQKLVWREDSLDALQEEFAQMADLLDGRTGPSEYRPIVPDTPLEIADRMARFGREPQARDIYLHLLADAPRDPDLLFRIGCVENGLGLHASALTRLQAIDGGIDEASLEEQRGDALAGLNRKADAIEHYRHGAEQAQTAGAIWTRLAIKLGVTLSELGRIDEMLLTMQSAIRADRHNVSLYRILGELCARHGFADQSRACFAAELSINRARAANDPANLDLTIRIAVLVNQLGQPGDAIALLEPLLAGNPSSAKVHEYLGDARAALGDTSNAIAHYRAAIAGSWGRVAEQHLKLARALHTSGQLREAMGSAEESVRHSPTYVPAYELLVELAEASGLRDEAQAYRRAAAQAKLKLK